MSRFALGAMAGVMGLLALQLSASAFRDGHPALASAARAASPVPACSRQQEAANKRLFAGISKGIPTPQDYLAVTHEHYIQHGPDAARFMEINGVSGRAGMAAMLEAFAMVGKDTAPPRPAPGTPMPPPPPAPLMMAECDLLLVMRTLPAPDPMNPGKTYTIYGFTLYRIRDGKLFEQWDDTRIKNPPQPYLQKTLSELRKSATGG